MLARYTSKREYPVGPRVHFLKALLSSTELGKQQLQLELRMVAGRDALRQALLAMVPQIDELQRKRELMKQQRQEQLLRDHHSHEKHRVVGNDGRAQRNSAPIDVSARTGSLEGFSALPERASDPSASTDVCEPPSAGLEEKAASIEYLPKAPADRMPHASTTHSGGGNVNMGAGRKSTLPVQALVRCAILVTL